MLCLFFNVLLCFFFFKQKTAYEMRISDWSSDVCSSDLPSLSKFSNHVHQPPIPLLFNVNEDPFLVPTRSIILISKSIILMISLKIGRASCRERVCQYV